MRRNTLPLSYALCGLMLSLGCAAGDPTQTGAQHTVILEALPPPPAAAAGEAQPNLTAPASFINFRDLGGARVGQDQAVRRGLVFRSGHFDAATDNDLRTLVGELGVQRYYDLRACREGDDDSALQAAGLTVVHLPCSGRDDPFFSLSQPSVAQWSAFYLRTFHRHGRQFAQLCRELANQSTPLVFGCSLGKDRTGVAAALLQVALGVDREQILRDYEATTAEVKQHVDAYSRSWQSLGLQRDDFVQYYMTADRRIMQQFLDGLLFEFGSYAQALAAVGVDASTVAALKKRLLHRVALPG
jgi:protein-tyrosine phosphatase